MTVSSIGAGTTRGKLQLEPSSVEPLYRLHGLCDATWSVTSYVVAARSLEEVLAE